MESPDLTAIVVFAHGSRVPEANESVHRAARLFAQRGGYPLVATAFLELAEPDLAQAVAAVVAQGARRVVVVPYFLTLGVHLQRDLPRIVEGLTSIHQGVRIEVTPPLDGHPALVEALLDRAGAALASPAPALS